MPIRPENRSRYPADWPAISVEVRERAGWRCEGSPAYPDCRADNAQPHPVTGSKVVLTVAHLDHQPENVGTPGDRPNLKAWCQRCHLTYDARQHAETAARTRALAAKPRRIQLSRAKGWRMPANTVKVDRTTRWGNPAVIGTTFEGEEVEDALHAVTIFRDGVVYGCEPFPSMDDIRQHLAGKNLACWCGLDAVCHADTLLLIANDDANEIRP